MGKYRKKPVVVDAYQANHVMLIKTLEGSMCANPGDWIITGVQGERYPCKPDIFAETYEPVDCEQGEKGMRGYGKGQTRGLSVAAVTANACSTTNPIGTNLISARTAALI